MPDRTCPHCGDRVAPYDNQHERECLTDALEIAHTEIERLHSSISYALKHLRPDTVRGALAAQAVEHLREIESTR